MNGAQNHACCWRDEWQEVANGKCLKLSDLTDLWLMHALNVDGEPQLQHSCIMVWFCFHHNLRAAGTNSNKISEPLNVRRKQGS
jgi:hypothetical protein